MPKFYFIPARIVSGGQTGVDRAGLDAAMSAGIKVGGYVPRGRLAEDGRVPQKYPLTETASAQYCERTLLNVKNSDATLILYLEKLSGGTLFTYRSCLQNHKPVLCVDISQNLNMCAAQIINFLESVKPA
ncbi:MAG: putative molybdenum carrier protein, partial [Elusimicrobia bacterium]|nr:putative molybdenum carrier protein [Elusimicrobiota bacterium]